MTSGLRANILHSNYVYCSLALSVVCLFEAALKECKHWRRLLIFLSSSTWADNGVDDERSGWMRWLRYSLEESATAAIWWRHANRSEARKVLRFNCWKQLQRTKEDPNKYRLITGFIATVVYFNSPAPSPHWFICRWKARRCGWANAKNGREKDGDSIHDTQSSSTAWWKSSFSIACKYLIKFH